MKNKYIYILIISGFITFSAYFITPVFSADTVMLKGSVIALPDMFFGLWRVTSKRLDTNSPVVFKEKGVDMWNISHNNDVINLSNPFSGASADIKVNSTDENKIIFTKNGKYGAKILKDTVSITINGDKFTGFDSLELDTLSDVDGRIIKTETAKYAVTGEKIAN